MSSNNEIENKKLLENKPYLTKRELGLLLAKEGKNLDKKITRLIKKEYLIPLKKGFYTTRVYLLKNNGRLLYEYLSNQLYYPSYLSLEYVLAQEGVIPETIFIYTAVALKATRVFTNQLGTFSYRTINPVLFTGFTRTSYLESYQVKIATKAKALFDWLYLKPYRSYCFTLDDLRLNWQNISQQDLAEFNWYVNLLKSGKMQRTFQLIQKAYDNQ